MCLSYSFIPCRTWAEGSGLQDTHTHTHTHVAKCANHGSRRQPSFSCQAWKQNRWEMKCWDWPDLADDCRLNSWGWNWAFYTLAAAQDTICPSLEDNMAWVACHVKYQFPGNSHIPLCKVPWVEKCSVHRKITSDQHWSITLAYTLMVQCLYWKVV